MSIQQAIKEAIKCNKPIIYTGDRNLSNTIVIHSKD